MRAEVRGSAELGASEGHGRELRGQITSLEARLLDVSAEASRAQAQLARSAVIHQTLEAEALPNTRASAAY